MVWFLAKAFCNSPTAAQWGCRHLVITLWGGPTGPYLEGVPHHHSSLKKKKTTKTTKKLYLHSIYFVLVLNQKKKKKEDSKTFLQMSNMALTLRLVSSTYINIICMSYKHTPRDFILSWSSTSSITNAKRYDLKANPWYEHIFIENSFVMPSLVLIEIKISLNISSVTLVYLIGTLLLSDFTT